MRGRKGGRRQELRMLSLIMQLGLSMLTCIFLCAFAGRYVSEKLDRPVLFIPFVLLGVAAGFRSCYLLIRRSGGLRFSGEKDDVDNNSD